MNSPKMKSAKEILSALVNTGLVSAKIAAILAEGLADSVFIGASSACVAIKRLKLKGADERELFQICEKLEKSSFETADASHEAAFRFARRVLNLRISEERKVMVTTMVSEWGISSRRQETIQKFAAVEAKICQQAWTLTIEGAMAGLLPAPQPLLGRAA